MAELDGLDIGSSSALRIWLCNQLEQDFPADVEYRDNHESFIKWMKMGHGQCIQRFNADKNFTTCTSFLTHVHRRINEAGKITRPFTDIFRTMEMHIWGKNLGCWRTIADPGKGLKGPRNGDFYQISILDKPLQTKHVGVFLHINSGGPQHKLLDFCTTISGGADHIERDNGGVKGESSYGAISRGTGGWPPERLMGWLDIDAFYIGQHGWSYSG